MKYNPQKIEKKWQKYWAAKKMHETKDAVAGQPNYMLLTEFPYPSGNLHIGHWYAFSLPDMKARYLRMSGKNVLYPIGFDAFGLPAENAAIKNDTSPEVWTKKNIAYMSGQLESMGAMFDWSRVVSTIDPEYYKWTQWMFLEFYKKGLAYRTKTKVNWCPKDKTVLANEQVIDEKCERDGTPVEQREIEQWMYKITHYADQLVDDMEGLDWPETTKLAQRNWIGRSRGAIIKFQLKFDEAKSEKFKAKSFDNVEVFTTRADTLFGATFLVVSPELVKKWMDGGWKASQDVEEYINKSLGRRELERLQEQKEKTGVDTGIKAINPISGEEIPVWLADYVLGSYGTGAIMAVPAHDERDFEFAKKFNLPIRQVIQPLPVNVNILASPTGTAPRDTRIKADCYSGEGELINSGKFSGILSASAQDKITEALEAVGKGEFKTTYRLRDWVLSRQRYWGTPIPMIKCETCGYVPVPEKDLPVKLPKLKDFKPSDDGRSPLAKAGSWVKVKCPKCDNMAERETDTMDTFVDSSWYFMRYADPKNKEVFAETKKMRNWMPVPMYIGGAEHNTMHLLYSRFFAKALHDLGHISFNEPFVARRNHGIVLGPDGQKMSKSHGNVVDPDDLVKRYGADTVRMYLAFMAPYEQGGPWDPKGINGVYRFLDRVWRLAEKYIAFDFGEDDSLPSQALIHKAIKDIGHDIEHLKFNTGVSELMKLLNHLEDHCLDTQIMETFLKLLAPLAPHITEEIWMNVLKKKKSIHLESWPEYDPKLLVEDEFQIPVQVNGKVRDSITVLASDTEKEVEKKALASQNVRKHTEGKQIMKVIIIPKRMVSVVVKD